MSDFQPLGAFIDDLERKIATGAPADSCVMCGTTTALLHPAGKAWACARCHQPVEFNEAEPKNPCPVCPYQSVGFLASDCFWGGCRAGRDMTNEKGTE